MGENPSHFSSCGGMCPVDSVSWDDVQEFISRVNQANEGMNYRLPTEAEWEYAARAGTTGDWGGTGNVDEMAWHLGNGRSRTHPVGLKEANAWGLHDMHGNVSEWVQDWYDWEYYKASPAIDPTGPATGTQRVLRGGDITSIAYQARSAWRGLLEPTARSYRAGFRLVKSQ
jgi:formylglycine-generating enzyme required for sulfatase activity